MVKRGDQSVSTSPSASSKVGVDIVSLHGYFFQYRQGASSLHALAEDSPETFWGY